MAEGIGGIYGNRKGKGVFQKIWGGRKASGIWYVKDIRSYAKRHPIKNRKICSASGALWERCLARSGR